MKKRKPTYLSFNLGADKYAVSTTKVLEVLEMQSITPVPNAPDFVYGVVSFRGNIIPVVSLKHKLGIDFSKHQAESGIIVFDTIIDNHIAVVAALVDEVHTVLSASENEIMPTPPSSLEFDQEFITGMLSLSNEFILIFDID